MRFWITVVSLLIWILSMNFHCSRENIDAKPFEHTFEVPVNIFPLKKTYSLTDTLWIETDLPSKILFDTRTGTNVLADTGKLTFGASFNEFGTYVTNPPNGFCDIITIRGVNTNRQLSQWGTSGSIENYGCAEPNYTCRVGYKPLIKGTYWLALKKDLLLERCANKITPYNATISYKYKNGDLGFDIFNSLSKNDKDGTEGIRFYTNKINNREIFVFKVE